MRSPHLSTARQISHNNGKVARVSDHLAIHSDVKSRTQILKKPVIEQVTKLKQSGYTLKNKSSLKFVDNASHHLKSVEACNTKRGIVGGHNRDAFHEKIRSFDYL